MDDRRRVHTLLRFGLYISAFTASWTAVSVGGFNLVDYALALTFMVMVATVLTTPRLAVVRKWMFVPLAGALITSGWNTVVRDAPLDNVMMLRIFLTTACVAMLLFTSARWLGPKFLMRVLQAWVLGVAINAAAAIAVSFGLVSFAGVLEQATGERLGGLASHPNSLAFSVSMALAPVVYLLATHRSKVLWMTCLAVVLWGGMLSESRSVIVVGLPTLAISLIVLIYRSRARIIALPCLILTSIGGVVFLPALFENSRLAGGAGALSDAGRTGLNERALGVFADSPIFGASFAEQAGVSVPLTVLTAGGLVFAIFYYAFILIPVLPLWVARSTPIAPYALIAIGAQLSFGLLNPVFMERATYWPALIGLVLSLSWIDDQSARSSRARVPVTDR